VRVIRSGQVHDHIPKDFKIAVSDTHLYLYSKDGAFRTAHADVANPTTWEKISLPKFTQVQDFIPWSEASVLAVFDSKLWSGDLSKEGEDAWRKNESPTALRAFKRANESQHLFTSLYETAKRHEDG